MKLYDRVVLTFTLGITGVHRFYWGDPVVGIGWMTFFVCGIATIQASGVGFYTLLFLYACSIVETLYWARRADPHPNWQRAYRIYRRYTLGNVAIALSRGGLDSEEVHWPSVQIVDKDVIVANGFDVPRFFVFEDQLYEYFGMAPQKVEGRCLFDLTSEAIWKPVLKTD